MAVRPKFLNIDMSGFQRAKYEELGMDGEEWHFQVDDWLSVGLKVSLSHDLKTGGYSATLTDRRLGSVNKGVAMTTWAGSTEMALEELVIVERLALENDITWEETKNMLLSDSTGDFEAYKEFLEWKRRQANDKSD